MCIELNAHAIITFLHSTKECGVLYMPWLLGSQSCEKIFRLARSMTSTFSTIINFGMLGLLRRLQRLQMQSELQAESCKYGVIYPQLKRHENKDGRQTLLHHSSHNISQQDICHTVCMAKLKAKESIQKLGMEALDIENNKHVIEAIKDLDNEQNGQLLQSQYDGGEPNQEFSGDQTENILGYITQQMSVRWGSSFSHSFNVSNGVRQGSVLSPVLFSVYLDGLLEELARSGVGCHCGCLFAGAICYADDIVLLAPCPSALRIMLQICDKYAQNHGLSLNADKTQLICFRTHQTRSCTANIVFNNTILKFQEEVTHPGHILSYDLDDKKIFYVPSTEKLTPSYVLSMLQIHS